MQGYCREGETHEKTTSEIARSLKQGNDIVVVTVYSLGGKSAESFADDYFDYNGYGQGTAKSGILLLHSPEYRDWWIYRNGFCISAFTDDGLDYIGEHITPYLADGEYYSAYAEFAGLCDKFLTQAKTDRPYDRDNLPAEPLLALDTGFAGRRADNRAAYCRRHEKSA